MLLDGADKDIVNKATEDGWTPLMYAAKAGAIDIAEFLVDNNADVNIKQVLFCRVWRSLNAHCCNAVYWPGHGMHSAGSSAFP